MLGESALIWLAAVTVVVVVVLPYLWRFHRRNRRDRERKAEARRLGIDRPAAQYPYVDPEHCVGCAACVEACPEGDVLGVVGGLAVVINGLRCVGHGHCETACPVGAITVGIGDLRSRTDMPLLSEHLETSVPGVFIAGELGGLSLVKNAVAQGRAVVEHVAARIAREPSPSGTIDLAIVGAGPSGISASLAAQAAGLSCVVLEKEPALGGSLLHYPRRKMVLTQPADLPPWGRLDRPEYSKEDLLEIFGGIVETFDLDVRFGSPVTGIERREGEFAITTASGSVEARFVLLALGRRGSPRKLGVPGEDAEKVMYRLIDATSYQGKKILVVGGGDSAVEAAIGLGRQKGNAVSLSYRREKLVRIKRKNQDAIEEAFAKNRIRPLMPSSLKEIRADSVVLDRDGEIVEQPNDYVFVFAGGVPPFGFLKEIGVEFGGP